MISRKYCRYRERMKTEQLHLLRDLFAVAGIFLVPDFDAVKVAHDGPHFLARSCSSICSRALSRPPCSKYSGDCR